MQKKTCFPGFPNFLMHNISSSCMFVVLLAVFANTGSALAEQGIVPLKIDVALTVQEISWLQDHPQIRIAGPRSFPPFHYFEKDGALKGMSADYIRIILKSLGVEAEIQADLPWPEVLKRAQNRDLDLISCSAVTTDRKAYLSFSQPYISFPLVIISRKDAPFFGGLEDLYGKKVAVIKKVSTYEWLQQDQINIVPHFVNTPLAKLEAVSFGQADAAIENLAAASYLIQKKGLSNLKIAAPTTYGNYDLHMAVRKDWPQLLSIINKALDAIPQEQRSAIRNKWLTVRYEHGIQTTDILKWVLLVVSIAIIILTVILIWNRRLQKEISERKLAEKMSQENWERYTALFERSMDAVYISDFDGNFLDANPAGLDLLEYSKEDIKELNYSMLMDDEYLTTVSASAVEVLETGVQKKVNEYKLKTKSGGHVWVGTLASLLYKDGEPFAIQSVARNITERKQSEEEREVLIAELQAALDNIKTLTGLLPICASCKKIRDDQGYWNQIETYIEHHSEALFSHSVCPDCAETLYSDTKWFKRKKAEGKI